MGIIYKNGIAYGNQPSIDATLTHQGEAADAKATGDAVSELRNTLNHKADVIYDTVSGDIASFPDGADGLPVKDLTVAIEPVQSGSGDPSPTNVRPISGWTGCILHQADGDDFYTTAGTGRPTSSSVVVITILSNNSFKIDASKSGNYVATKQLCSVYNLVVGKTYTIKAKVLEKSNNAIPRIAIRDSSNLIIFSSTAIDSDGYIKLTFEYSSSLNYISFFANFDASNKPSVTYSDITLIEGNTTNTIPISWQSEAGTVYGGTLDVTSGVLTVTDANIASYNGETLPGEWISDRDVYAAGTTPTTGAQVVYKLSTPQTYQLTPIEVTTLLGQNNIWADCGPSTVEYPADTKLYIQKINAPTDDDMIADANIASGQYFIVNNNLYISTAAILAGDPIKPGTNCTLTNLAAALNALNS